MQSETIQVELIEKILDQDLFWFVTIYVCIYFYL